MTKSINLTKHIKVPTPEEMEQLHQKRKLAYENNLNDIAKWYPILEGIIKMPKTKIFNFTFEDLDEMYGTWDNWEARIRIPRFKEIATSIITWMEENNYTEAFIKSGTFSDKHSWIHSCYFKIREDHDRDWNIEQCYEHIEHILYNAELVGCNAGLSIAVREFLHVDSPFTAFNGLPISRERRIWYQDGKVYGYQPYWPEEAIDLHTNFLDWKNELRILNSDGPYPIQDILKEAEKVGHLLQVNTGHNHWAIDYLHINSKEGWMLTDVQIGEQSYKSPDIIYINREI